MPEQLKNLYNETLVQDLATSLQGVYPSFQVEAFAQAVFTGDWEEKELKQRMHHIALTLKDFLPSDYAESISLLKQVSPNFSGFEYMFFPGFVELFGLNEFDISVSAMEHFTPNSSSEFAVRPFIIKYGERMMGQMDKWAQSDNYHVRRLASEGCRPRLPWAMALPEFKADPARVLPILEQLKQDESEYVRRSVANNLNDIAKDNPEIVVDIARQWLGLSKNTDKLVKHACRTLLKQGHPLVLEMFGFNSPSHITVKELTCAKSVAVGDKLGFSFELESANERLGKLRIEYALHFVKKNGQRAAKVFKLSEADFDIKRKQVQRQHSFKKISTRVYYPGIHKVELLLNGISMSEIEFELLA